MALHEQAVGKTDEWYTPKYIFDALGVEFDIDVASPWSLPVEHVPAQNFICKDSLGIDWDDVVYRGFVWMNPPFGGRNGIEPWLDKFVEHRNGIALFPDRTSAPWWHKAVRHMDAVLFVTPKIKFIGRDGQPGKSPAQGTCLGGIGERAIAALYRADPALGTLMVR